MQKLNTFQSINERDVDLLILEELNVSEGFARWLTCLVREEAISTLTVGAWHSVSDASLGESDLVYLYKGEDKATQAILIENKIDASAQPKQGERYQQRGNKGVEEGDWQDFRTCLIAPKAYIAANSEFYDTAISYEEIMAYFASQGDKRGLYRAQVIKDAIDKNRRGYVQVICPKTTEFATKYLSYVARTQPQLNPEVAKPRAGQHDWIHFYPNSANKQIRIIHQISGKLVKLQFRGQAEIFDHIKQQFEGLEQEGYRVVKSCKSVNIETPVPEIKYSENEFESVMAEINIAIEKAQMLNEWMSRYQEL